ncbi:hypothetical protein [Rhizobacter sp. P5_C2]
MRRPAALGGVARDVVLAGACPMFRAAGRQLEDGHGLHRETPTLCSLLAALISLTMSVTRLMELTTSVIVTPA